MANNLLTNPVFLDTFSSDFTISATPIRVKGITFTGTNADDTLVLEDKNGVWNVRVRLPTAKDSKHIDFGTDGHVFSSLVCDVSDGAYNTAYALIYKA